LHAEIFNALLPLDPGRFHTRDEISRALSASIPEPAVRQFLLKNIGHENTGAFRWKMNLSVIHHNYPKLNEAIQTQAQFPGPTLFVRSSNSDYITDRDCNELTHLFPNSIVATIPNAGHWVHSDAPTEFLQTLLKFLR
ncbi:MAG TPA: hypothetical protein VNH19_04930, partial [Candidatus Limnocylindrales bacterium]|nr:hypothetical protein [Candidatus Limnocylindrales bacterium]